MSIILWLDDSSRMSDVEIDARRHLSLSQISKRGLDLNPSSGGSRAGRVVGGALVPARILDLGFGNVDH